MSNKINELRALCAQKLAEYVEQRGAAIWEHRTRGLQHIQRTLRYEVFQGAEVPCELWDSRRTSARAAIDHIVPRNHGVQMTKATSRRCVTRAMP